MQANADGAARTYPCRRDRRPLLWRGFGRPRTGRGYVAWL